MFKFSAELWLRSRGNREAAPDKGLHYTNISCLTEQW